MFLFHLFYPCPGKKPVEPEKPDPNAKPVTLVVETKPIPPAVGPASLRVNEIALNPDAAIFRAPAGWRGGQLGE
jgi:hypothetical protein